MELTLVGIDKMVFFRLLKIYFLGYNSYKVEFRYIIRMVKISSVLLNPRPYSF